MIAYKFDRESYALCVILNVRIYRLKPLLYRASDAIHISHHLSCGLKVSFSLSVCVCVFMSLNVYAFASDAFSSISVFSHTRFKQSTFLRIE